VAGIGTELESVACCFLEIDIGCLLEPSLLVGVSVEMRGLRHTKTPIIDTPVMV
jgi:hypothetical protein